ncbi:GNAT family N-acetyltransferase [Cognatishimia sp. F0-27]|uniref:GNAT family N-acetyltransferase n=1 Tax=Cognatishimia sp. F0-27 TaxID=2816855 RepID=UPI001D0CBECA|nr:GNAT family N-acetyltransferase [Cognatishimia sp. F0-27]MCC1494390.1 GNAT family N-acetyltransferase [Cognatishimia sp. F0-27]
MKSLHLATEDDADRLLAMVAAFHGETGFESDEIRRAEAIGPLLDGSPHGAIWLIGPRRAPVGYIAVSFGWSLEYGGLDAIVDELYIRAAVRGRGMGGEALNALARSLREAGVKAMHLEAQREDTRLHGFYRRARFVPRDGYVLMSRVL